MDNTNLKFSGFKVGQTIKAFDFMPMDGRPDQFVQGKIVSIPEDRGYACYEVKSDAFLGDYDECVSVFVPMELDFMEYDQRITLIMDENGRERV
jgi:hypothetical protein